MAAAGALLVLGSLAIPLAMAIALHMLSPRGSRESLSRRLGYSGQGSLVILLVILTFLGAFVIGLVTGPLYCLPVVMGLAAVGIPALAQPPLRWSAVSLTTGLLVSLRAWLSLSGLVAELARRASSSNSSSFTILPGDLV